MKKPWGRSPKVVSALKVALSDEDRRLVEQLCRLMNVGQSELFHILLTGSLQMAGELNNRAMEVAR